MKKQFFSHKICQKQNSYQNITNGSFFSQSSTEIFSLIQRKIKISTNIFFYKQNFSILNVFVSKESKNSVFLYKICQRSEKKQKPCKMFSFFTIIILFYKIEKKVCLSHKIRQKQNSYQNITNGFFFSQSSTEIFSLIQRKIKISTNIFFYKQNFSIFKYFCIKGKQKKCFFHIICQKNEKKQKPCKTFSFFIIMILFCKIEKKCVILRRWNCICLHKAK